MGLHINLYVQFEAIDSERWEAAYLTSLQLLEEFPGPLARTTTDEVRGIKRWICKTDLLFDVGGSDERWEVDGDLGSRRMAEPYRLYRHAQHYGASSLGFSQDAVDILWGEEDKADYHSAGGRQVFGDKTQGYPYHYAMLAVAVLIENTFPQHAVVMGDINRLQAKNVLEWAESVLGRPLRLPIIMDSSRLWPRLMDVCENDQERAIRRFRSLMVADAEDIWRDLLELCTHEYVRKAFVSELQQYKSLGQRGASGLIVELCDAENRVDRVIDWVCGDQAEGRPSKFSAEDLLNALCGSFLTIPPEQREVMKIFEPPRELANMEETIFHVFTLIAGKPTTVNFWMAEEELLAAFTSRWPDKESVFRKTIQSRTEKCREVVDATQKKSDELVERLNQQTGETDPATWTWRQQQPYRPSAEFILAEIERQRRDTSGREEKAREFGETFRQGLATNHEFREMLFGGKDRDGLLEQIFLASSRNGFALTESAWRAIEDATLEDLQALTPLALLDYHEVEFSHWRRHILESPELWPMLANEDDE